ncbi:hypothetical protein G6F57_001793 [Rhizopus arrhizus]|nr:hypothetical protein G6F24_001956 [Rhizopus arrhizus]KAG0948200.1 hypothetical protein G6F30_002872 [Rhizopus arrhizus]KAG0956703.1 hypothetical protein G6F32_001790 [Rhizopus arrhizus]KAG0986685.1 hypothetical protein G6F29_003068 [Rhizopus arrhizus]KAG0997934.1 hypothetical protein G6F28_002418 [Rhizopus arrhizus]
MDRPPPTKKTKLAKTETEELDGLNKSYEQHSVSSTATTPSLSEINKRVSFASGTNSSESVTVPTKEPRLVMKKMVLNNFKSYAGRQVIGPFHKSFSAIVGPNGSGKSNVIDALLFVFGYRANKMRQGKLSELIHNSAKHPNCQACTVEIHFHEIIDGEGINDYQIVPGSQLVVARQASRNNASKYFINDKASNFTEVTSLLKARGIDLDHKRFLILQGEVESIALMKPKAKDNNDDGLLEYLEDIIGTSKYKTPIEEASVRLEALNEVRGEKVGRVKYVSREMEGMEEKKAEAENYLENENELAQRKNELYQIYLYETRQNVDVATRAIEELNTKMSEEVKKCEAIEQEKLALNDTYQQTVDAYNEIEKESEKIAKRQAKLEREDVQLREKKEHMVNKQEKGKATLESDREARLAAQEAIKKNTEELNDRKEEVTELEKQLKLEEAKLEEVSKELKGKTDSYLAQIEQHQKELAPWTEKINEKQKTIDVKRSEIEILTEQIMSGKKAVEEAEEQATKIKKMTRDKKKELEALPNNIKEVNIEIKELESYLLELAKTESDTRAKLNVARQKADEARLSLQHSQNRGKVLSSILRMRDSGRIDGIYDRLGSLGVIDDKYDVAISTACPALDNIVVETVEAAQACIQYLRKNNLGRAVFTVLNQLRHQRTDKIKTPEHVPRLFDLVEPKDKKFIPAFYSVLQDTLVAEDLKQANRIAYGEKRWRVVTVDGKLIEKSGAMTGGGNKQLRGAMSSTFREEGASAETVAALESERDGLEKKYKDVSEEKRATELGLKRKKDHLPRLEVSFEKLQMDLRSLETQLEEENSRIEELKKQVEPRPSDLKRQAEIEEEIEQIVIEIGELKEKTVVIEKTIASLHEQIMDAGGMELRQQKTCVNNIRKRIDQLNDRITKNMVAKSKAEKDVTKLEASIRKFERDTEMFETNLKELEKEANELAQDMATITEKVEQTKKLMEEKKVEMEEFKQQIDEKTESINKLRQAEVNIKNELEDYKRTLIDNEKKAAYWEEQRSKLFLQQITGEETDEQLQLHILEGEALQELAKSKQSIKMIIAEIEAFVQSAKPNLSVLDEYRRRLAEYNERKKDLDAVTAERDTIKNEVDTLRKARLDEFMQGFNIISQKLKEMYQMITMGGNAELELVDSLDPFSEGIVFSVMPPKKSWKNISNLSGGEKTLSSLSLVFALHHFKPTPLYVMDEIDAALDFRNVSIVANYIAERTKNAQFVIISLRNNMFELADRLVGIYKTSNCTKSIAINPNMIASLTSIPTNPGPSKRNLSIVR